MAIEKFYDKLYTLSSQIDDMQEKISTMDSIFNEHFNVS
jgi:hypothetical protein